LIIILLAGCGERRQLIKTEIKTVYKIVVKPLDKNLTEQLSIRFYELRADPTYLDLKKLAKLQRLDIQQCNLQLKQIRKITSQENDR